MHYDVGGTCIDLTLLFAAVFRSVGLRPFILILGEEYGSRHALAGAWTASQAPAGGRLWSPAAAQRAVGDGCLLVVETTLLPEGKAFEDAAPEGRSRALAGDLLWGVDVTACREDNRQILALPEQPCLTILSGLPDRITHAFSVTRSESAADLVRRSTIRVVASPDAQDVGRSWDLAGCAVRLGRSLHNQIQVSGHGSVSREHAVLFVREGSFHLKDLGSRNGTWLGEVALEPFAPRLLPKGGTFRLGDVKLQLL